MKILILEKIKSILRIEIDEQFIGLAKFFIFFLIIQFGVFWLSLLLPEKNEVLLARSNDLKKIELIHPNEVELVKYVNPVRKDVFVILPTRDKELRNYKCNEVLRDQEKIKLCRIGLDSEVEIKSIILFATEDLKINYLNFIKYEIKGVSKELKIANPIVNRVVIEAKAKNSIILITLINSIILLLVLIILKIITYNTERIDAKDSFRSLFNGLKIVFQIIAVVNFIAIWIFLFTI